MVLHNAYCHVDASGYLYFKPPEPHRPAVSGEIRFRLATTPETFTTGKDLEKPDGERWGLPLFTLINTGLRPLYEKLVEDGLVTQEMQKSLVSFSSSAKFRPFVMGHRSSGLPPVLYNLSDSFTIDLSTYRLSLFALTDTGFARTLWSPPFQDGRSKIVNSSGQLIYKGIFPNQQAEMGFDHPPRNSTPSIRAVKSPAALGDTHSSHSCPF